jgi:hypothetical protein
MDPKFAKLVDSLAPKLKELLAMKPVRYRAIPMTLPMKGVYLFSKGNKQPLRWSIKCDPQTFSPALHTSARRGVRFPARPRSDR